MRYQILKKKNITGKSIAVNVFRWLCYFMLLILFYCFDCNNILHTFQPSHIVSLAVVVAMLEGEFSGTVFAVVCGLFLDMEKNSLMGFSAILLMIFGFLAGLFATHLIKKNIYNFMVINTSSLLLFEGITYFFNYAIWEKAHADVVLRTYILPSIAVTIITSPIVYFGIRLLHRKMSNKDKNPNLEEASEKADEKTDVRE